MFVSNFEQLPDEIILQICLYLRPLEIVDGFGQLNDRLNRTITQFRYHSDTHHLTLTQYQRWCTHLLPFIAESIVTLVLSNWNSPGQIVFFNQTIGKYRSLHEFLPNIRQLRLIDFSNDDIDILPKLEGVERILIDIDALKPLLHSTKLLLDRYLFCSSFPFKEIRLWIGEGGIRLQHSAKLLVNPHLEQLTIVVARLEDLFLLFRRTPNLSKLYVEISQSSWANAEQYIDASIMPKYLTDFHIQTSDYNALTFDDIFAMIIHIPSIKLLSLDIETNDRDYADGVCWNFLKGRLPNLNRLHMKIRIGMGAGTASIDVDSFVQSFARTDLPIICYADKRVLYIDTVPYDMREFQTNMAVTTSPSVKHAKITNMEFYQRRPHGVQLLFLCGRHEPTSIHDWLFVLRRFPSIQALDLTAVNIKDQIMTDEQLHLPRLVALRYIRSTGCQINLSFFLLLTKNPTITPRLRALTIMYSDLINLCKRLPGHTFDRLKELLICGNDTDGRVIIKDVDLLLRAFPNLQTFSLLLRSSRLINRHVEQIIEMTVDSLSNLISFRLICRQGSLKLPSFDNEHSRKIWLKRRFALDGVEKIHLIVSDKEISIWK